MAVYDHHVFVCINERDESDARGCCKARGGADVHAWFKAEGKTRDWKGRIRVNKSGCLDQCEFGPAVVVYPEGIWYSPRTVDEVAAICSRHIEGGEVVEELRITGLE